MIQRFLTGFFFLNFALLSSLEAAKLTKNNTNFVEIEEMIIPIIQYREVKGFLSCTLALDCRDQAANERIEKYYPLVRDRIFWYLFTVMGLIWNQDYRIDVNMFKTRIQKVIDDTIGAGFVKQVLVLDLHNHRRQNAKRT